MGAGQRRLRTLFRAAHWIASVLFPFTLSRTRAFQVSDTLSAPLVYTNSDIVSITNQKRNGRSGRQFEAIVNLWTFAIGL